MSSFIGHSIPAISFYFFGQRQRYSFFRLAWLVLVAWVPDIDYLIPALRPNGFRTTHSLLFCSILPCITIFILYFIQQKRGQEFKFMGMQVILTAFSHLVLDLSVGVGALPLLYPFSSQRFKFPFGLLPSAGKIDLSNYFFYRNIFIEIGILLPLFLSLYLLVQQEEMTLNKKILIFPLVTSSVSFMAWAFSLSR
jgi:inner membrane protein